MSEREFIFMLGGYLAATADGSADARPNEVQWKTICTLVSDRCNRLAETLARHEPVEPA